MQPKRIVSIGSSSLFGLSDPAGGGYIGRFKTWYETKNLGCEVYNLGIPGDTTRLMLSRFDEVLKRRPDFIFISSGLNDSRRYNSRTASNEHSLEEFRKHFRKLLEKAKKIAPVICIGVYPIDEARTSPIGGRYFYLLDDARVYENEGHAVCGELSIPYVSNFAMWEKDGYMDLLAADGLHANAKGHEKIFLNLRDEFLETIKR